MKSSTSGTPSPTKPEKPRRSRGKGLRTTAGCLTCRKRRSKCDEIRPHCGQCTKSSRECVYAQSRQASPSDDELLASPAQSVRSNQGPSNGALKLSQLLQNATPGPSPSALGSPLTTTASFTSGNAPHYWYDLIAEDAVKNIDNYNFLTTSSARWNSELRRPPQLSEHGRSQLVWPTNTLHHSPKFSFHPSDPQVNVPAIPAGSEISYNTVEPPVLRQQELRYLQHYLEVVAPILDLFDHQQHFKIHVLHLALRNVGLSKSILALSALYMGRITPTDKHKPTPQPHSGSDPTGPALDHKMATQYYYETLGYLSQAMQCPGYPHSQEILANASLIGWYEALDTENSSNWESHLKDVFWIQRSQNTNGEADGLRKAVWWNWLRQPRPPAATSSTRHERTTLAIWRPTKAVRELDPEELACRALYLQAKAVGYASEEVRQSLDFGAKFQEGDDLLEDLREWYSCLPRAFRPLPSASDSRSDAVFPPIWIHPPIYAAAMQAYYSAKILVLLNRPSLGGPASYHDNQKTLDDCVASVCGIARGPNAADTSLAFVNSQALFFAGQCARTREQQDALLILLESTLDITKFPSKSLLDELRLLWSKS